MYPSSAAARSANESLARVLAHAIDAAGKPRHRIANESGMHRDTLLRIARGERPIGLDEAARVLAACGAHPRATMVLALSGQEDLACEWMHCEMGEFLEGFFTSLPVHLERTLGRRIEDLRPRWAGGTAQLVARMLAKHIDDVVGRDIAMSQPR